MICVTFRLDMSNLWRFGPGQECSATYSWSVLSISNFQGHPARRRMIGRIQQLVQFHSSCFRLPSPRSTSHSERSLYLFGETLKARHRDGLLSEDLIVMLTGTGLLDKPRATGGTRAEIFMAWLTRVENFVKEHGYRPGCSHENDLYQWLVRARRRHENGALDEITARRLGTVLAAPDRRQYRARMRDSAAA